MRRRRCARHGRRGRGDTFACFVCSLGLIAAMLSGLVPHDLVVVLVRCHLTLYLWYFYSYFLAEIVLLGRSRSANMASHGHSIRVRDAAAAVLSDTNRVQLLLLACLRHITGLIF